MGFNAILSADDLKRGDLVDPGWYPCEISSYEEKEANTDKSTNCIFNFKVIDGTAKGNQFKTQFNEKALGFGKNLYGAIGLKKNANGGYDLSSTLFKEVASAHPKLRVYVVRGKSDKGNEFNEVKDYQPLT
jgi:hypothetical protein